VRIEYVGHATVVVDLDGSRIVTDPLLRNRVAHLRRMVPLDWDALRGVDAVLISHAHYDHLDLPSLEELGKSTQVVVSRGLGALLRKRRFERVTEVEAGDVVRIGALEIRAVHAEHESSRGPFGVKAPPLGYVVSGSRSVYFAGDTDLFEEMATFASPDLALIPIWGWGPSLGRGRHLDPRSAAEALLLLRPRLAIPIHWGTYAPFHLGLRRSPAFLRLPPVEFARAAAEVAPEVEVRIVAPGESIDRL
jgi:L-ascorbate metabolism protein UlaG (beta-lactamase superfamily)